ncbi:unnamed protein product [Lampetra planeri]
MGNRQATAAVVKKEGADAPEEGAGTVGDEGRRSEPSLAQGKGQGSADGDGEVRPEADGSDAVVAGTQELAQAVLSGDKDGPPARGQGAEVGEVTKVAKVMKDACSQQAEAAVAALIPAGAVEAANKIAAERSAVRKEGEEDRGGDEEKEEEEVVVEEEEFKEEEVVVEEEEEEVDDEKERHLEKIYHAHPTEEDDEEDAQVVPPIRTGGGTTATALSNAPPAMAQTPVTLIRAQLLEPAINVKDGATPTSDELEGVNEEVKEVEKTREVEEVPVEGSTRYDDDDDDDDDDDGDAVGNVDAEEEKEEEEEVVEVAYVVMEKEEEEEEPLQQLMQNKMAGVVAGADVESSPFRVGGEDLHGDLLDAVLRDQEFSTQIQSHI